MDSLKSWITVVGVGLLAAGCAPASANSDADGATPEMASAGEEHYVNYCAPCHGEGGAGNPDVEAPSIAGLPYWYVERQLHNFRIGVRGVHYDDIAGKRMRPMAWALPSDKKVREVAAYVAGVKDDVGQTVGLQGVKSVGTMSFSDAETKAGEARYAACAACHGPKGLGNETLGAPKLVHLPDWYLITQLRNFKYGVRGQDPRDTWGQTMYPMAMALEVDPDENVDQIREVVAYIQTLRN